MTVEGWEINVININHMTLSILDTNFHHLFNQIILMSSTSLTASSSLKHIAYTLLEGEWPVLDSAVVLSDEVLEDLSKGTGGSTITDNYGFLSLGYFLICPNLLELHPTQRDIDQNHVAKLREDFQLKGILRVENPGVVIGMGSGWLSMKKNTPFHMLINEKSEHRDKLSLITGGPIGQIIRGGHRSAAITSYCENTINDMDHNYWLYNVLVPGMS